MVWSFTISKCFRIFGSKCYIKRDDDVGKFDPRSNEGMFLGYSLKAKHIDVSIIELRQYFSVQMLRLMKILDVNKIC